jgi:hypothetical protein
MRLFRGGFDFIALLVAILLIWGVSFLFDNQNWSSSDKQFRCDNLNVNINNGQSLGAVHCITHAEHVCRRKDLKVIYPFKNKINRSLIFLKTHKTGSSTLTGILWREFCQKQHRNCFLPPHNHPGKTWDFSKLSDRHFIFTTNGTQGKRAPFDVWLNHVRRHELLFNKAVKSAYLDRALWGCIPEAPVSVSSQNAFKFVSIVRRPAFRFRSAWAWYDLGSLFSVWPGKTKLRLKDFIEVLSKYLDDTKIQNPFENKDETYSGRSEVMPFPADSDHKKPIVDQSILTFPPRFLHHYVLLLRAVYFKLVVRWRFKYHTGVR